MPNDEKKVWTTEQVAPCPFKPNHVYVVQELQGHFFTDRPDQFFHAEKHKTRVLYMEMDEYGKLTNVYRD